MMETEASSSGQNNDIRELLTLARQLINQGKPSQALQAVILFLFLFYFNILIKLLVYNSSNLINFDKIN